MVFKIVFCSYDKTEAPLDFVVNLGDIIDGHVGENAKEKDEKEVKEVLHLFESLKIPTYL